MSGAFDQFAGGNQDHNSTTNKQGGTAGEFYHLTAAEYTGTGTGNFVRANGPTLVNPIVGTQSQGDGSTKAASTAYVDTLGAGKLGLPAVVNITGDTTLSSAHLGKVLVVTGQSVDITLPSAASVSDGWCVTITNANSTNSPSAHTTPAANTPFGQDTVTLQRQGSDTLFGQSTQIHGTACVVGPRQTIFVFRTSSGGFAAIPSAQVGWKDLLFSPHTHGGNANDPAETRAGTSFYRALEFTDAAAALNEKEVYCDIHIGHDYLMGSKVYPHVHWLTDSAAADVVRWGFQYSVAKGHSQQAFFTEGGGSTTVYKEQANSTTAYTHQIAEVSDADAIPATNLEPDSLVLLRLFRNSSHANDTLAASAWAVSVDLHYLSDRPTTPNKAPAFYV